MFAGSNVWHTYIKMSMHEVLTKRFYLQILDDVLIHKCLLLSHNANTKHRFEYFFPEIKVLFMQVEKDGRHQ